MKRTSPVVVSARPSQWKQKFRSRCAANPGLRKQQRGLCVHSLLLLRASAAKPPATLVGLSCVQ